MPTENPRITFAVTEEMFRRINEYKFEQHIDNRTQAILSLINAGLSAINNAPVALPLSVGEKYKRLDDHGRRIVDLVLNEEYSRCANDDADAEDLETIINRRIDQAIKENAPSQDGAEQAKRQA